MDVRFGTAGNDRFRGALLTNGFGAGSRLSTIRDFMREVDISGYEATISLSAGILLVAGLLAVAAWLRAAQA